ncbi:MAG TPA: hypothetical protein VFI53_04090 [Myxococcaceae bacterium]|nr:hypothetical protein [Myxococcaceae bacterium]
MDERPGAPVIGQKAANRPGDDVGTALRAVDSDARHLETPPRRLQGRR